MWDNHGAHWSQDVVDLILGSGATLLPLPVNSSDLNPIERVWAQLKPRWHQALYTYPGDLQPENARALLERVLQEEVVPRTRNYAHGGRDILLHALEAKGVLPPLGSLVAEPGVEEADAGLPAHLPQSPDVEPPGGAPAGPRKPKRRVDAGGWRPNQPSPGKWGGEGPRRGVAVPRPTGAGPTTRSKSRAGGSSSGSQ